MTAMSDEFTNEDSMEEGAANAADDEKVSEASSAFRIVSPKSKIMNKGKLNNSIICSKTGHFLPNLAKILVTFNKSYYILCYLQKKL